MTAADFRTLGSITARLHDHAARWARPAGFARFAWDWPGCLGDARRWGDWRAAAGVGAAERAVLTRAEDLLADRLARYGAGVDRFGLIHADLRVTNLLVDTSCERRRITVIDFDDCGFGWLLYDFGAAVSFVEDHPDLPEWQTAWLAGYREHRPPPPEAEQMLASFVLLRRLLLLAWMGTHTHTREAAEKAVTFAAGSATLAEGYLRTGGRELA